MLRRRCSIVSPAGVRAAGTALSISELRPAEASAPPLLDQLVGYYVNVQSRKMYYKDCLRIEHQAVRWAFADLRKNSEALAHGLLQTGLRPGDRVLAVQPCNAETMVMQLACAKIGAMCAVVPFQNISADKLRYYLNLFQPHHFVGREWLTVPERRGGGGGKGAPHDTWVERNMHFWDTIYNVLPELGLSYPGQTFQWVHSSEFEFLKKCFITDHNTNLLCTTPMRRILVWGPFSYYEQRLRRLSALLHPDDPILALEDPTAPGLAGEGGAGDKGHIAFSHRHCLNAGYLFATLMKLTAEDRFGIMPNHHTDPIGSILAPYAALTSGAVLVQLHENLFTDEHVIAAIEKMCVEEVRGILGTKSDFDALLRHATTFDADQYEHLQWVALFENGMEEPITAEYMTQLKTTLQLRDVFVFTGPIEACHLVQWRSLEGGGVVPHTTAVVVGDRGTSDAKILSAGVRGNLRLKGPHVSPYFYNHGGLLTELQDERGFTATGRDAIVHPSGRLAIMDPQVY